MFGFGKKAPTHEKVVEKTLQLPVDLNTAHTFTAPGLDTNNYPVKTPYGAAPYATHVGTDLPTIKNQDAILTHWFEPPADQNPQAWYNDRNQEKILESRQEKQQATSWQVEESNQDNVVENPWLHTKPSDRVTATMSPSNYRFIRPFDQRFNRNLNGNFGSAAELGKSYAVGGMQSQNRLRNTFRLEPTRWDIENFDLSSTNVPAAQPAVYVSPSANMGPDYWSVR